MPTPEKARIIEETKDLYGKAIGLVFTDYRGLKVKEMQALRASLRDKGGELHVVKNTLFRIAAGEDTAKLPDELHNGPTAIAFIFENETECAKALVDYTKANKSFHVKGGYFGGRAFSETEVIDFSKLPPRDVLLAQVIGAISAPLSNLVGVIEALYADPIRVIGAVADKVAEGAPAPAPAPAPAAAPPEPEALVSEPVAAESAPEADAEATSEASSEDAPAAETPAEEAPVEAPAESTAEDSPAEDA